METTEYFGRYVQATPPAPPLTGTERVPVIIGGITNNCSTQEIANLAAASGYPSVVGTITAPITVTAGTGGPTSVGALTTLVLGRMYTVLITIDVTATDATAVVAPTITFTDPTGPQTITFPTFTMSSAQSQTYEANLQGTLGSNPAATISWTLATGTGTLSVSLRLIDNGP